MTIDFLSQPTFGKVRTWLSTSVLFSAIAVFSSSMLALAADSPTTPPAAPSGEPSQALSKMFSQEIRDTLNACATGGGVILTKGAGGDGSVLCKENKKSTKIPYNTYLTTFSDFVSAGFLVGFRSALQDDPQAKGSAAAIQDLFKSEAGEGLLKQVLTTALANTQAIASDSQESLDILVAEVLKRTQPILRDSAALDSLFGSPSEYKQIVEKFCTIPGMSVPKAQAAIPGITSIQLYASCIQASGLAKEITSVSPAKQGDPAKPIDPAKPEDSTKPSDPVKPEDSTKP